jgi:hypothetical protein
LRLFKEIYKTDNIKNILFYKWLKLEDKEYEQELNKVWIFLHNFKNRDDVIKQILKLNKILDIIYVHTTIETTMNLSNHIKTLIWHKAPVKENIFRDKFLQREMINDYNPDLWIKYLSEKLNKLSFTTIKQKVWMPFILKPINWVQSSGVALIKSRKDFENYIENYEKFAEKMKAKNIDSDVLIAEEYIDGILYSIDYFVWSDWSIRLSEPIKEKLWIDIGVDDYFVLSRITTCDTQDNFRYINLEKFVSDSVKAMHILNSFVHHEFKINSKWQLKTIEVNWRIGWWRHELMYKAFWINFFKFITDSKQNFPKLKENVIWINVLATNSGTLKWFNDKIFKRIEEKESVYEILKSDSYIWKEVWLTKDWFARVWTIKLANDNIKQLMKDYQYIEENYKKLLVIDYKYISITKIIKIFTFKN